VSQRLIHAPSRITAKQRLVAVAYAREHGIKRAARHFGWAPRTVRAWVRRWQQGGAAGLAPKIPSPRRRHLPDHVLELIRAAQDDRWSASRTRAWLEAAHDVRVSTRTIQRVLRDMRAPDGGGPSGATQPASDTAPSR
jgi:transposase